jgi:hypothetical protein
VWSSGACLLGVARRLTRSAHPLTKCSFVRLGWTSGKLSGSDCSEKATQAEESWIFVVVFLLSTSGYFIGGIVVKRQQGRSAPGDWLPNHQFWAALYGLVIDGVGLVARGGKPAGYSEISAAVDAMAKEKATGGGTSVLASEQEIEDPMLAKRQATRSQPTSLHSAATVGDVKKLKRLLKASGCAQIDCGDSRRYTAFHVACAAGHLDCKNILDTQAQQQRLSCQVSRACSSRMQVHGCYGMLVVTRNSQTMWV